jgi:predicted aminopeptidase
MARPISQIRPVKPAGSSGHPSAPAHGPTPLRRGLPGFWLILLCLPLMGGCSGGYLFQAAVGQYHRIVDSIPLEAALKDPSLGEQEVAHLRMIEPLKQFAVEDLGFAPTESYSTAYLEPRTRFVYTVSASPKDRLSMVTWWFPVVGRVPYLGFFDLAGARAKGKRLSDEGMDVFISRAAAYSTLGWFDDPVTRNMLEEPTVDFIETVLHEMTHATLYLKSQPEFNETLASVVAKHGTILFLEAKYGGHHPWTVEATHGLQDERTFSAFLSGVLDKLEAVYEGSFPYEEKMARRAAVFAEAKRTFELQSDRYVTSRFQPFLHMDLNNASILALGLYHRYFNLLESVLCEHQGSIPETIVFFRKLAETEPDIIKALQSGVGPPGRGHDQKTAPLQGRLSLLEPNRGGP